MLYPEFNRYKSIKDELYPLINAYENELGDIFYVEPMFYQSLLGYKDKTEGRFEKIIEAMDKIVRENHKVVFTIDYEYPAVNKEDFIYRELQDITDSLHLTWIDDSRPSDYGD